MLDLFHDLINEQTTIINEVLNNAAYSSSQEQGCCVSNTAQNIARRHGFSLGDFNTDHYISKGILFIPLKPNLLEPLQVQKSDIDPLSDAVNSLYYHLDQALTGHTSSNAGNWYDTLTLSLNKHLKNSEKGRQYSTLAKVILNQPAMDQPFTVAELQLPIGSTELIFSDEKVLRKLTYALGLSQVGILELGSLQAEETTRPFGVIGNPNILTFKKYSAEQKSINKN